MAWSILFRAVVHLGQVLSEPQQEWDGVDRRTFRSEHINVDEFHRLRRRVDDHHNRIIGVESHAVQWNQDSASNREQLSTWRRDHEKRIADWIEKFETKVERWMADITEKVKQLSKREFIFAALVGLDILVLSCAIIVILTH